MTKLDPVITISAKFIAKDNAKPLNGDAYSVKLYDKDIFDDDFLGSGTLNEEGQTEIKFGFSSISSFDSPGEKKPDLYFILFKDNDILLKSKPFEDLDLSKYSTFNFEEGTFFDLGTFVI